MTNNLFIRQLIQLKVQQYCCNTYYLILFNNNKIMSTTHYR